MIVELKLKGFTAQAIENELGFSNGSLGKKLSSGREYMLRNFYEVHCGSSNVGGVISKVVWKNEMDGITRKGVVWDGHAVDTHTVLDYDTVTLAGQKLRLRVTAELVKDLYDRYLRDNVAVVAAVGRQVLSKKSLPSASSDDVPGDFVFPDGLDDVLVDYQKLYDECMFPDEYKALWERISSDPNVSAKELPIWKIRLNVK